MIRQRLKDVTIYDHEVVRTYVIINSIEKSISYLKDAETSTRGFLLTKDTLFLEPYFNVKDKIPHILDTLGVLLKHNTTQYNKLQLLQIDILAKLNQMQIARLLKISSNYDSLYNNMKASKATMDNIRLQVIKMQQAQLVLLKQRKIRKAHYEDITPTYLSVSLLISLLITLLSFLSIIREFLMRANNQKKLEKSVEELNQRNSELEQIAEISSHDLQEPLRKLGLFSSKLLYNSKSLLDDSTKSSIERIAASAQHMQSLIDDVITYQNISKAQLTKQSINLNTIIADISTNYIDNNALQVFVETLPNIEGDKTQLILVFKHLLENAINYAKPTIAPFVKIKYEVVNGSVIDALKQDINYYLITVSDNGIGFNEAYAHKLFTIFRRLHGQEASYQGKGIGLAICKKILFNHQGYITANSKENEGATFNLYLPIKKDN
jgi:signal transduction histidine kinase